MKQMQYSFTDPLSDTYSTAEVKYGGGKFRDLLGNLVLSWIILQSSQYRGIVMLHCPYLAICHCQAGEYTRRWSYFISHKPWWCCVLFWGEVDISMIFLLIILLWSYWWSCLFLDPAKKTRKNFHTIVVLMLFSYVFWETFIPFSPKVLLE